MRVDVLMPTLFPRLASRALESLRNHGAEDSIDVRFVVVGAGENEIKLTADDVTYVVEERPRGVNAALRAGIAHCDGDLVHVTCDDVIYQPGWLERPMRNWLSLPNVRDNRRVIMGVRHAGGIGTCWGRMYANFPLFERKLLDDPYMAEHFMPEWLRGQWGDVAFSLACWHSGGIVLDDGGPTKLSWASRLGHGEAPTKGVCDGDDMTQMLSHFGPVFGEGWGRKFRDFNVDCDPAALIDSTICIPSQRHFRAHMAKVRASHMEMRV